MAGDEYAPSADLDVALPIEASRREGELNEIATR
jgi:hypothetical protein